jgi:hypothetical protein
MARAGTWLAGACAVHCLALPVLAMVVPAAGIGWLADERLEWALIGGAAIGGLFVLLPSYLREHRRPWALLAFGAGVSLLWSAHVLLDGSVAAKVAVSVAGAGLLVIGQWWNRRMCRECHACCHV